MAPDDIQKSDPDNAFFYIVRLADDDTKMGTADDIRRRFKDYNRSENDLRLVLELPVDGPHALARAIRREHPAAKHFGMSDRFALPPDTVVATALRLAPDFGEVIRHK